MLRPFQASLIGILASLLKAGDNRVDIVSTSGSWFLYDRIMLETPPSVVSARSSRFRRPRWRSCQRTSA